MSSLRTFTRVLFGVALVGMAHESTAQVSLSRASAFQPCLVRPSIGQPEFESRQVIRAEVSRSQVMLPDIERANITRPDILRPDMVRKDILQPQFVNGCETGVPRLLLDERALVAARITMREMAKVNENATFSTKESQTSAMLANRGFTLEKPLRELPAEKDCCGSAKTTATTAASSIARTSKRVER
jgi:hypothetical protein